MKAILRGLAFLVAVTVVNAGQQMEKILTSAERGVYVDTWEFAPPGAAWSIKKTVLHGGKQEGVDVITVNNGKLEFTVSPTRGMGLLRARMGKVILGWESPVKEVVHPKYIDLQSRGGLGWLEGFNELVVRCGLEFAGHPGKDKFINNVGDEAEMDLTLHGKVGNIPASEVEVRVDTDGTIRVRGRVDERMFYGPKLEMWTEISTKPGSETFTLHDSIKNHGAHEQEFQLIYHCNYGATVLGEGSRFLGAVDRVAPFNAHAAKGASSWNQYAGPTKGFIEQVYCLFPRSDSTGKTRVMLQNRDADQGISMEFSTRELPFLTLWKNTAAMEEGYVTGIEPGTGFPFNRRIERLAGRVPKLKAGETRDFTITYQVLDSKQDVTEARGQIEKIQGSRQTKIDTEPLPRAE